MGFGSFTEAVNAAKAGNQEAFSWLYEKTSKEKYYIAIKYMKNQTDAADVLQDAYMKAWQRLGSLTEPEKFPGWVGQIVANTALDALRKKKPLTFSDMSGENDEGEEFVYDIEDESIDRQPELNYTNKERSEIIRSMIDSLSDEQRMCVMMFYIEEMSVKEIAETLGVSENTVKSRLNYGRKNIKAEAEELKKKGYNFYSIAPLPLLLLLLRGEKASAMGVSTAGATASTAGVATSAAGIAPSSMSANTSTVSGATTTEASSVSGAAASAGANVTKGFFGTVAGKVVVGAAIVAAIAGLGFAGYEAIQSMNAAPEQVVEAPVVSGQAVSEQQTETPIETPAPDLSKYYDMYLEYFNENQYSLYSGAIVFMDDDEIPDIIGETYMSEEEDPNGRHRQLAMWTIKDDKVVESKTTFINNWLALGASDAPIWCVQQYIPRANRLAIACNYSYKSWEFRKTPVYETWEIDSNGNAARGSALSDGEKSELETLRLAQAETVFEALKEHKQIEDDMLICRSRKIFDAGDEVYVAGWDNRDNNHSVLKIDKASKEVSVVTDDDSVQSDPDWNQGSIGGYEQLAVKDGYIYAEIYGPGSVDARDDWRGNEIYRISFDGSERELVVANIAESGNYTDASDFYIKGDRIYYRKWNGLDDPGIPMSVKLDGTDDKKEDSDYQWWSPMECDISDMGYWDSSEHKSSYSQLITAGKNAYEISFSRNTIKKLGSEKIVFKTSSKKSIQRIFADGDALIVETMDDNKPGYHTGRIYYVDPDEGESKLIATTRHIHAA